MPDEAPNQTQGEYGRLYAIAHQYGINLEPKTFVSDEYWMSLGPRFVRSPAVGVRVTPEGYKLTVLCVREDNYVGVELEQHYTAPDWHDAFHMLCMEAKHQLTLKDAVARLTGGV